jgi:hypothetical protein
MAEYSTLRSKIGGAWVIEGEVSSNKVGGLQNGTYSLVMGIPQDWRLTLNMKSFEEYRLEELSRELGNL